MLLRIFFWCPASVTPILSRSLKRQEEERSYQHVPEHSATEEYCRVRQMCAVDPWNSLPPETPIRNCVFWLRGWARGTCFKSHLFFELTEGPEISLGPITSHLQYKLTTLAYVKTCWGPRTEKKKKNLPFRVCGILVTGTQLRDLCCQIKSGCFCIPEKWCIYAPFGIRTVSHPIDLHCSC